MPDRDPSSPFPPELIELRETLARHTHDVWMSGRLADGWTLGPARDDAAKTHPCLIPYDRLPESEKDYDRATSLETLKLIQSLDWQLTPPSRADHRSAALDAPALVRIAMAGEELEAIEATPDAFRQAAHLLRAANAWIAATHLLTEATRRDSADVELLSLHGLALGRSNRTAEGLAVMERLYNHGHRHEESLGILASLYKHSYLSAHDETEKKRLLTLATDRYLEAYHKSPDNYWPGINAATLLSIADRQDESRSIAEKVRDACAALLDKEPIVERRYWLTATLAEAALLLGDDDRAAQLYKAAAVLAAGRYGWIVSTRRNLRLLLTSRFQSDDCIRQWLPIPPVICFSGHAIDRPEGMAGRFPSDLQSPVSAAIRDKINHLGVSHGFSSASCGGDLLFIEAVLAASADAHLVLPYRVSQFTETSLDYAGPSWRKRFDDLISGRPDVHVTTVSESKLMKGWASYEYAIQVLLGMAVLQSRQLDTDLVCLALLDTKSPGDERFGVRANVKRWQQSSRRIEILDLAAIRHRAGFPVVIPRPTSSPQVVPEGEIAAMIFADVVGFSSLGEDETPNFAQHFFRIVSELVQRPQNRPMMKNTWGDGLFFVFHDLRHAGQFALDLRDQVIHTRWKQLGFSRELSIRIGLHAGPVLPVQNSVTERTDYLGTHVSRAARLEPVTPPGSVYATARYVAVAHAQGIDDLSFSYAGTVKLPKGAGKEPVYVVQRRD